MLIEPGLAAIPINGPRPVKSMRLVEQIDMQIRRLHTEHKGIIPQSLPARY